MTARSGRPYERLPQLAAKVLGGTWVIVACSSNAPTRVAALEEAERLDDPLPDEVPAPSTPSAPSAVPTSTGTAPAPPPPRPTLYDPDTIPHFELTLDDAAVAILSSPNADDKAVWVHGAFKLGDVTFADVGVRRKGSYSLRALPAKTSLKIKLNKWVKGQKLHGLEELTLNNNMSDHTFLEQRLGFHVFRSLGLPAMLANAAQLTINGEYYGLYTNVETPDENFLARVFGSKARTLYEAGGGGAAWLPGSEPQWEIDVPAKGAPAGTKPDLNALFQAVAAANDATLLADLEGHLHTTRFLRYCAAEAITGQHDGYAYGFHGANNYFLAGDTDGKFSLVPWSADTMFVASSGAEIDASKPVPEEMLLARCRRTTTCWDAYKTEVASALAVFETLDLANLAKKWHEQIDALARTDPKREHSVSFYESQTNRMYEWIAARPTVIRAQLGL